MCGIVGFVSRCSCPEAEFHAIHNEWLSRAGAQLLHRGPDSGGCLIEDGVAFGARRLRVHDLASTADQPFTTSDGSAVIVWNGAIFNFVELRSELRAVGYTFSTSGDTEVLAVGYCHWGCELFSRLDGMFAIAILDRDRRRVVLARDRLGIKPLYYHCTEQHFAFCSEIKPLLSHPDIDKVMNRDVVAEFLAFQFVMAPDTFFRGIKVMMPGTFVEIDCRSGAVDEHTYWRLDDNIINAPDALPLEEALLVSLRRCWSADRTAGVQLSGGVDSSLICLLSDLELGKRDYSTYSILFDDSTAKYYLPRSEQVFVERIASQCGVENFNWTFSDDLVRPALAEAIWYHEQPLYGASTCLYMLLARRISESATVLLTGEGADDIFLGYFPEWNFDLSADNLFKFFIHRPVLENLVGRDGVESAIAKRWDLINEPRLERMTIRQKASVVTIETVLHGLLARHDRMFMSNSIEGRPPFCTHEVVKARFAMDDDHVHNGTHGKFALKRKLAELTDTQFAFRKKIGFSAPFGDWCASPAWWNGYVNRLDCRFLSEFIDCDMLGAHQALPDGKDKWSQQNLNLIFSLTQFQLWHDIFFGDDSTDLSEDAWKSVVPQRVSLS